MSTIKVNTIETVTGVEQYLAKAWVNFNGQGVIAIRTDGNVSSLTDNGVGDATITFTSAITDANYTLAGAGKFDSTNVNTGVPYVGLRRAASNPATSTVRICTQYGAGEIFDCEVVTFAVHR